MLTEKSSKALILWRSEISFKFVFIFGVILGVSLDIAGSDVSDVAVTMVPKSWIYINDNRSILFEAAMQLMFYFSLVYLLSWFGVIIPLIKHLRDNGITEKVTHLLVERAKRGSHELLERIKIWIQSLYLRICKLCLYIQDRVTHIYEVLTKPRITMVSEINTWDTAYSGGTQHTSLQLKTSHSHMAGPSSMKPIRCDGGQPKATSF